MRKYYLIAFLCFNILCILTGYSQNYQDSLWSIWTDTNLEDTSRLKALENHIDGLILAENYDDAIRAGQVMLSYADDHELPNWKAVALSQQSSAFYRLGEIQKAIQLEKQCFFLYKQIQDVKNMLDRSRNLAVLYSTALEIDSARYYGELGLKLSFMTGDTSEVIYQLNGFSMLSQYQKDYPKALEFANQALSFARQCKDTSAIIKELVQIAKIRQDQREFDESIVSLTEALELSTLTEKHGFVLMCLNRITKIYGDQNDFVKFELFAQQTLQKVTAKGDFLEISDFLDDMATIYFDLGFIDKAISTLHKRENLVLENEDFDELQSCYRDLGTIYEEGLKDYEKALFYYKKATQLAFETEDFYDQTMALINEATIHIYTGEYDTAIELLNESEANANEFEVIGAANYLKATIYNRFGKVHRKLGNHVEALNYSLEAYKLYSILGDDIKSQTDFSLEIGTSYANLKNYQKGLEWCELAHKYALESEDFADQKRACTCLYEIYSETNSDQALYYLRELVRVDDSLDARQMVKKVQQIEFARQLSIDSVLKHEQDLKTQYAHQEEIATEKRKETYLILGGLAVLLLAGGVYSRLHYVRKSKAIIEYERDRSESLLLNILPEEIAEELKEKGKADARDFDIVSIIFSDFKGFTEASAKLNAQDLVKEINSCFEAFDGIMEKYNIEKIKTIGDAYMAAGGLPVPDELSVRNAVLAALEMQEFIVNRKKDHDSNNLPAFEMRVGIHTGPVVAGIVGVKKFQYDIWGDTVNTASRMESAGEVGKVNISQATYELLKTYPQFAFESRGKIEAKGKGEMDMYFVSKN